MGRSLVCAVLKDDFEMLLWEIGEHGCNTFERSYHQLDFDNQHCTKLYQDIIYFVVSKSWNVSIDVWYWYLKDITIYLPLNDTIECYLGMKLVMEMIFDVSNSHHNSRQFQVNLDMP